MYDNIKLKLPYHFENDIELQTFCSRFSIVAKDLSGKVLYNKEAKNLEQNKGVFFMIEKPTATKRGNIIMTFTLHKFYNDMVRAGRQNYDMFNFENANRAFELLKEFTALNFAAAIVEKLEIGMNIKVTTKPETYLKELWKIETKNGEMRILEIAKYKDYKGFTTKNGKDIRTVYIFYDKTHEARSKIRVVENRKIVPENILRVEIQRKRFKEKLKFTDLFTIGFQKKMIDDLETAFIKGLTYKFLLKPQFRMHTEKEVLFSATNDNSLDYNKIRLKQDYDNGLIPKRTYYNRLKKLNNLHTEKAEKVVSRFAIELKTLIINKLNEHKTKLQAVKIPLPERVPKNGTLLSINDKNEK